MRVLRRTSTITAASLGTAFLLTACAASGASTGSTPADPAASQSTSAASCEGVSGPLGDAIPLAEVTDQFGSYCHVTVDPASPALAYDASKADLASLETYGFTEADAKEALATAVRFAVSQTFDSTRLDNYAQTGPEWVAANAADLSSPEAYLTALDSKKLSDTGLLITDYLPEPTLRDGGPRASQINVQVNRVYAFESDTRKKALVVEIGANALYSVSNQQVVNLYLAQHPDETSDSLKAAHPEFFGNDAVGLVVQGTFGYSFLKETLDKVAGSQSTWIVNTQTGVPIVS